MPDPNSVPEMPDLSQYLFVYGTLMRGFTNPFAQKLEKESTYIRAGYMPGRLYLIDWYPGAIWDERSLLRVHGEIYRLHSPEPLLAELDEYEDVFEDENSSLYLRRKVGIRSEEGPELLCWAYLYNQPVHALPIILSGKFHNLS